MKLIDWTLIDKSLAGALNDAESESLSVWLAESEEHQLLYRKIENQEVYSLSKEKYDTWKSEYLTLLLQINRRRRKTSIRRRILLSVSVAAVFAIIASLTLWLNAPSSSDLNNPVGQPKVQLQLADGQWLDLDAPRENHWTEGTPAKISSGDKTLVYPEAGDTPQEEYNILRTERGGEWNVVLSDGTRVYLNASSMLKYPVSFTGDSREVILEGEAYFEVTPHPEKPFIVRTNEMNIRVRGTSFNVNAYSAQKTVRTTLVDGKIEVECSGSAHILLPGQQVIFEKETKSVTVADVDTELYTSWKNGFYKFNDTRLEDILTMLSLRYDVDVIYADESVKEMRFTSSDKIMHYDNIMSLLKKFEYTDNVSFELDGRCLIVRQK